MNVKYITVDTENGPTPIALRQGAPLVIAGPNGVGKSALLQFVARSSGKFFEQFEILTGFRPISFASENVDNSGIPFSDLSQQLSSISRHNNRYRNHLSDPHTQSIVKRFLSTHNQNNEDLINDASNRKVHVEESEKFSQRAIPILNSVFASARLSVRLSIENGELKAQRGEYTYGIDRMSDGERAALLLVAAIIVRPAGTLLAIDEPERNLNPGISGPLIAAATRSRPDLFYAFATHDLSLCDWLPERTIIHVIDSKITNQTEPETRQFSMNIIAPEDEISEALQISLLGSRKDVLFVEGEANSTDRALFSCLYPHHSIVAAGGWETVTTNVKALRTSPRYHHLNVAGLIDADGRDPDERTILAGNGVMSLPTPTVENLFFQPTILHEMASAIVALKGGMDVETRVAAAEDEAAKSIQRHLEEIIRRRVVWRVTRELSNRKISVKDLASDITDIPPVNVEAILSDERDRLQSAIASRTPSELLWTTPIKNTGVPANVAKAIGFENFSDYRNAVLRQIESGTPAGLRMIDALRNIMPDI